MQTWQKVAIGAGLGIAVLAGGYCIYKKAKSAEEHSEKHTKEDEEAKETSRRFKRRTDEEGQEKDWESLSDEDEDRPKANPVQIMDEVLVDSMEYIFRFYEISAQLGNESGEEKEAVLAQIKNKSKKICLSALVENLVAAMEQSVCERVGWDVKDYYEVVKAREEAGDKYDSYVIFDREITKRIDQLDAIISSIFHGEKLTVNFQFDPQLTKKVTLTLYRWILCGHLHLHQKEIQDYLQLHQNMSTEEMKELLVKLEPLKTKRRC